MSAFVLLLLWDGYVSLLLGCHLLVSEDTTETFSVGSVPFTLSNFWIPGCLLSFYHKLMGSSGDCRAQVVEWGPSTITKVSS